jgi:hypothetical protein
VTVQTPFSNVSALRTYEPCGMHVAERLHAMFRPESAV